MARRDRFVDPSVAEVLTRQEGEVRPFWRAIGPPVAVHFAVAGAVRQVAHQLGAVPTGRLVCLQTGAVHDVNVGQWTDDLAFLTAPVANTRAVLVFLTLREDPLDV